MNLLQQTLLVFIATVAFVQYKRIEDGSEFFFFDWVVVIMVVGGFWLIQYLVKDESYQMPEIDKEVNLEVNTVPFFSLHWNDEKDVNEGPVITALFVIGFLSVMFASIYGASLWETCTPSKWIPDDCDDARIVTFGGFFVAVVSFGAAFYVRMTKIQGDFVDDRDTIVKDSVINKSNIGTGEKSKSEELREAKALLDDGIIDDDEFKQMKKEILGK